MVKAYYAEGELTPRPWSSADIAELERLVTTTHMTLTEIGRLIGRTKGSVCRKAMMLGLDEEFRPAGYVRWRGGRPGLSDKERQARRVMRESYSSMEHW